MRIRRMIPALWYLRAKKLAPHNTLTCLHVRFMRASLLHSSEFSVEQLPQVKRLCRLASLTLAIVAKLLQA